jgi:hypothetical protein
MGKKIEARDSGAEKNEAKKRAIREKLQKKDEERQ